MGKLSDMVTPPTVASLFVFSAAQLNACGSSYLSIYLMIQDLRECFQPQPVLFLEIDDGSGFTGPQLFPEATFLHESLISACFPITSHLFIQEGRKRSAPAGIPRAQQSDVSR